MSVAHTSSPAFPTDLGQQPGGGGARGDGGGGGGLGARPASLLVVLLLTAINSVGTGLVTNGVYYLAEDIYDLSTIGNYGLGVVLGLTYIAGALAVGPAVRRAIARFPWLSARGALVGIHVALGLSCLPIWAASGFALGEPRHPPPEWLLWTLVAVYGPITGALWPIVESFLSGGRRGADLRRAVGGFNLTWAGAVAAALLVATPLVAGHALALIAALGVLHLIAVPLCWGLPKSPGRHMHEVGVERHPPVYRRLLMLCRFLLPMSYFALTLLTPTLPWVSDRLALPDELRGAPNAVWSVTRIGMFALLLAWTGWHGRWWLPLGGFVCLGVGVAGALLTPWLGVSGAPDGVWVLGSVLTAGSLALFGVGLACVYSAALYYAMTVGDAEIDAGGTHETLIGLGYTLGPLVPLLIAVAR